MLLPPIPVANYANLLAAQIVAKQIKPFAPVAFRTGRETWFEGSSVTVLQDARQWEAVWTRHTKNGYLGDRSPNPESQPPAVDFSRNVLVALFAGPTRGVIGYRVVTGFTLGKEAAIRLAPVLDPSGDGIVVPTPWAFVILPRTDSTVNVEVAGANGWNRVAQVRPSL